MRTDRREFVKLGAAAAASSLLPGGTEGAEMVKNAEQMPAAPGAAPLRLLSFSPKSGGTIRVGALTRANRIVDLGAAAKKQKAKLAFDPAEMLTLIASGETGLAQVRAIVAKAGEDGTALDEVKLAAPIPDPARNVYAVGWNYVEHFEEGKSLRDAEPDAPRAPGLLHEGLAHGERAVRPDSLRPGGLDADRLGGGARGDPREAGKERPGREGDGVRLRLLRHQRHDRPRSPAEEARRTVVQGKEPRRARAARPLDRHRGRLRPRRPPPRHARERRGQAGRLDPSRCTSRCRGSSRSCRWG